MSAQPQQTPKHQLLTFLQDSFPHRSPDWRAQAALAIGMLRDDEAATLVGLDADSSRAVIERLVEGRQLEGSCSVVNCPLQPFVTVTGCLVAGILWLMQHSECASSLMLLCHPTHDSELACSASRHMHEACVYCNRDRHVCLLSPLAVALHGTSVAAACLPCLTIQLEQHQVSCCSAGMSACGGLSGLIACLASIMVGDDISNLFNAASAPASFASVQQTWPAAALVQHVVQTPAVVLAGYMET